MGEEDFCKQVLDDFSTYQELMGGRKRILKEIIYVNDLKKNRQDWLVGSSKIDHPWGDTVSFEVEVLPHQRDKFKFFIKAINFSERPLARYDSAGPAHRNPENSPHYSKQKLLPPHFHKWDDQGRNIAYRTEELNRANLEDVININRIIILFCQEMNAYSEPLGWPEFKILENPGSQELFGRIENDDPLKFTDF